ncbi:MAG TPA: response regulator [bacterium]|nr:response regulator [bacterium]
MVHDLVFIDDSEAMQRAVSTIFLSNQEFKLDMISEPSMLLNETEKSAPDLIILNYDTINTELKKNIVEIKNSDNFSDTPLLLLVPSDLSDKERESLIELKADGFIYRPFDKNSFISKIKRTISAKIRNKKEVKTGEKIYDISSFEVETNTETSSEPPSTADATLTNPSAEAASGESEDSYNADDRTDTNSSELSQAFENLFKDDAIFKEFKELNKKESDSQVSSANAMPETQPAGESIVPANSESPSEKIELTENIAKNLESENSIDINHTLDDDKSDEHPESDIPLKQQETAALREPAMEDKSVAQPISDDNDNINADNHKGELNLKILDEQDLVKLDDYLRDAIEKTLEEVKPRIVESIKNTMPDIIEKLVKEEIEKIKQQ